MPHIPFFDLAAQYRKHQALLDAVWAEVAGEGLFVGGHWVERWESAFAQYIGVPHAVACANGTDALELAFEAIGIGPGDEVIVPALSWASSAMAVSRVGARPVFADTDAHGLMPLAEAKACRTPRTRAVLAIHLLGHAMPMPPLMAWAQAEGLWVVEDCAQAHGARSGHKRVGAWGHIAAFSFYPTKNLGAYGDAGMVLTADPALARQVRLLANMGQRARHEHVAVGRNSRLDTLQAALLLAKLPLLPQWNAQRHALAQQYCRALAGLPLEICLPASEEASVWHLMVLRTPRREALQAWLQEQGIGTAIHYPQALPDLPAYGQAGHFPQARRHAREALSLPLYPELPPEHLEAVAQAVREWCLKNG